MCVFWSGQVIPLSFLFVLAGIRTHSFVLRAHSFVLRPSSFFIILIIHRMYSFQESRCAVWDGVREAGGEAADAALFDLCVSSLAGLNKGNVH